MRQSWIKVRIRIRIRVRFEVRVSVIDNVRDRFGANIKVRIISRIKCSEMIGVQGKVVLSFRLLIRVIFGAIFRVRYGIEICVMVGV